jgi:hypothetical protein
LQALEGLSTLPAHRVLVDARVRRQKTASRRNFSPPALQANLHQGTRALEAKTALDGEVPGYFAYAGNNPLTHSDPSGLSMTGMCPQVACPSGTICCSGACLFVTTCPCGGIGQPLCPPLKVPPPVNNCRPGFICNTNKGPTNPMIPPNMTMPGPSNPCDITIEVTNPFWCQMSGDPGATYTNYEEAIDWCEANGPSITVINESDGMCTCSETPPSCVDVVHCHSQKCCDAGGHLVALSDTMFFCQDAF